MLANFLRMMYNNKYMIFERSGILKKRPAHGFVDEYYWDTLDNAAKLVPAVSDTRGSNVFRVSAVLCEEVDPKLLSDALDKTLSVFPAFSVRLRRGLFWYYLDANRETPRIREENDYPCAPISSRDRGFLFRVTYYKKRINLEMYHALSDGMGAAQFLHVLVCFYFSLMDGDTLSEEYIRGYCDKVARDFDEDSFGRIVGAAPEKKDQPSGAAKKEKEPDAFQFGGYGYDGAKLGVVTFLMRADKILNAAHGLSCTMSEYLASLLIWSIYNTSYRRGMGHGKPIVISLPVNLRGMFDSTTMRNFFGHINIAVLPKPGDRLPEIVSAVKSSFSACLDRGYFEKQIAGNVAIERITPIRFVPVWIKDLVMRFLFSRAEKNYTITMSNLGRLTLPEAIADRVERMEMLLGGSRTHPKKVSLCSYGNTLAISFSSTTGDNSLERFFAKEITSQGIGVTLVSNETPPPEKIRKRKKGKDCDTAKTSE